MPINPQFGSLNLAQAVILVAYEWSKAGGDELRPPRPPIDIEPPAPMEELDGMFEQLCEMLEAKNYFYPRRPRLDDAAHVAQPADQAAMGQPTKCAPSAGVLSTLAKEQAQAGGVTGPIPDPCYPCAALEAPVEWPAARSPVQLVRDYSSPLMRRWAGA